MTDTIRWDATYLANKVIEQQDLLDEMERKLAAAHRTIRTLAQAIALTSSKVDVPSLDTFMDLIDVREEVAS